MSDTNPTESSLVLDGQNQFWSTLQRYDVPFEDVLSIGWSKYGLSLYGEQCWVIHLNSQGESDLARRLFQNAAKTEHYRASEEGGGGLQVRVFVPDALGKLVLFHWLVRE